MAADEGTIITISQQKGGAGKTTLAAHLAVALTNGGKVPVALLDTDPQGSLGEWFETRERALGEDETGLGFRTSSGWGVRREVRSLARDHRYVIVDTPPKAEMEVKPAVEAANLLLVPVQPTPVDLWATEQTLEMAASAKVPARMILSRVPPRARLTGEIEKALAELDVKTARARLGNRTAYAASMGQGLTIMEIARVSKGADEIKALTSEISKLVKSLSG